MTRQSRTVLTRLALAASTLSTVATPVFAQSPPITVAAPVASSGEMRQRYIWSTLGVKGALHAVAFGSYDQWRNHPSGWERSPGGLAQRVGASYARYAISDTTKYVVAEVLHQDPSFAPCECSGLARRLWHAIDAPFMARNRDGERVPSPATVGGIAAGHLVAAGTWYPEPFAARAVLRRSAMSLATKMATNVFREFRPRRGPGGVKADVAVGDAR